jgi:hypothetical protein
MALPAAAAPPNALASAPAPSLNWASHVWRHEAADAPSDNTIIMAAHRLATTITVHAWNADRTSTYSRASPRAQYLSHAMHH